MATDRTSSASTLAPAVEGSLGRAVSVLPGFQRGCWPWLRLWRPGSSGNKGKKKKQVSGQIFPPYEGNIYRTSLKDLNSQKQPFPTVLWLFPSSIVKKMWINKEMSVTVQMASSGGLSGRCVLLSLSLGNDSRSSRCEMGAFVVAEPTDWSACGIVDYRCLFCERRLVNEQRRKRRTSQLS